MKLVLMSATLNTSKLSAYFGGIPQINMGGSVFPVAEYFLEDVLRLTDYVVPNVKEGTESLRVMSKAYYCSVCGEGPFKIAEELGGHAAFCYLRPGKQFMVKRERVSTRDISAMVQTIFAKNSAALTANSRERIINVNESVQRESWDEEAVDEDEASKDVIAVQALDASVSMKNIEDVAGDPLLRQYQRNFDDSQVDYELILSLLSYIFSKNLGKQGSVLIFFPGWEDISTMSRLLRSSHPFQDTRKFKVLQLHSAVPRKAQSEVFNPVSDGQHKIILSTNIAETSITIDDVSVVIDSGKMKEESYDPFIKLAFLKTSYVSKASAKQRRGRAGRTRAGDCYHLFSKTRFQSLNEFQDSELMRLPLDELVLQTKILGLAEGKGNMESFLGKAMDPPHPLAIENALALLKSIHCINDDEDVTVVGQAVGKIPIDPKNAFTILFGCVFGIGNETIKSVAAMSRNPFVPPPEEQKRVMFNKVKANLANSLPSDHFALLKALDGYVEKSKTSNSPAITMYCERQFLSRSALSYLWDVSNQMSKVLGDHRIIVSNPHSSRNSGNYYLLMAIIGMGLYPAIAVRRKGSTLFTSEKGPKAKLHASSVNHIQKQYKKPCVGDIEIMGFDSLVAAKQSSSQVASASLLMINTTPLSTFALILSCSKLVSTEELEEGHCTLFVDDWLKFDTDTELNSIIYRARSCLIQALVHYVRDPQKALPFNLAKGLDAIGLALTLEQQNLSPFSDAVR